METTVNSGNNCGSLVSQFFSGSPIVDVQQKFLSILGREGNYQYFWNNPQEITLWFPVGEPNNILTTKDNKKIQLEQIIGKTVYFGVNPSKQMLKKSKRGGKENIASVTTFFGDFDAKDGITVEKIENLNPPPSVVISSGGGWHCYWFLKNPIKIKSQEHYSTINQVHHRWVKYIGSDTGAQDLTRILRLPGSKNPKYDPPREVEFISANFDLFYDYDELVSYLPKEKKTRGKTKGNKSYLPDVIAEGSRNDTIFKLASSLRSKGLSDDAILSAILVENEQKCDPPLDVKEIENIVNSVSKYEPGVFTRGENLTDLGNAKRFVSLHKDKAKYCKSLKTWFIWDGKHWKEDTTDKVFLLAEDVIKSLYFEAANAQEKEDRESLARHAQKSESAYAINQMVFLAGKYLPIEEDKFDCDNDLVNVSNGILNLGTGELFPHDPEYLMSKIIQYEYNPGVECPKWLAFLDFAIKDKDTIRWIQKALGLSLSGRADKILPLLYGPKDTGKSTFSETMLRLLGDYAQKTNLDAFSIGDIKQAGDKPNAYLRRLKKARFVIANETKDGQKLDVALIKDLTGVDTITSRGQYDRRVADFKPTHTIWIYGNHKPSFGGDEPDVWGRVAEIDFQGIFTPDMRRPLDDVLNDYLEEASGILNWIVQGYQYWVNEGIQKTERIEKATKDYMKDEDIFGQFIDECMEFRDDYRITKDALMAKFNIYCQKNFNKKSNMTKAKITRRLKNDWNIEHSGSGNIWLNGLKMTDAMDKYLIDEFSSPQIM